MTNTITHILLLVNQLHRVKYKAGGGGHIEI